MPLTKPDLRVPPPRGSVTLPFFRLRAHYRPLFWSLLSLVLFVVTVFLEAPEVLQGMFLTVPLMIATVGWGWPAAAKLVPVGILIVWATHLLSGHHEPWWFYLGLLSAAILSLVSGQSLYRLWWESDQQVKAYARRAKLLSQAVMHLQQASTEQDVFEALPRLLANILSFTHAHVFVLDKNELHLVASYHWHGPKGLAMSLDSISGRAARTKKWQYVPDVERDPEYVTIGDTSGIRSELAIPLLIEGEVRAVLNIEDTRVGAFGREDQQTLTVFTRIAEETMLRTHTLSRLERRAMERDFIAELSHALMGMEHASQVAKHTLRALKERMAVELGVVFTLRGSHFVPLR